MPGKWTAWVVIAAIIALCGVSFAADGKITGWRGDGTGRYPEATPVTRWGYWPKSPSWGLKYQLSRPKPALDGEPQQNRMPVPQPQDLLHRQLTGCRQLPGVDGGDHGSSFSWSLSSSSRTTRRR